MLNEALLKNPLIDDIISDSSPLPEYISSNITPTLSVGRGGVLGARGIGPYEPVTGYCLIQGEKCTLTTTCVYIPQPVREVDGTASGWYLNGSLEDGFSYDMPVFVTVPTGR